MSRSRSGIPSYRLHKTTGKAIVTIGGRDYYLGPHGTETSRNEYDRLIAEWLANGRRVAKRNGSYGDDVTVSILLARFMHHAERYYRKPDGRPTSSVDNLRQAIRPLRRLYGLSMVDEFGPRQLKAVRQEMINRGWCRTNINQQIGRIRLVFRWGVENEMVSSETLHALRAVSPLKRFRSDSVERDPVRPVKQDQIDMVLPLVGRQVAAMIQLQLLSGARPGEIVIMRMIEIDMNAKVWFYKPERHKTEHHGHERLVPLGPKSQKIIRPFLNRPIGAYLFSPAEAEFEWRQMKHLQRKTKVQPSQQHRAERAKQRIGKRKRAPRDRYDVGGYRRAIQRACKRAGIESWHPHQLRHTAATNLRREYGIDTARIILGQTSISQTAIYAEADTRHASQVMLKSG